MLKGLPGDMEVLIPVVSPFDGRLYSPCMGESGVGQIPYFEDEEDALDEENYTEDMPQTEIFLLVPHGFTEEPEGVDPEMN